MENIRLVETKQDIGKIIEREIAVLDSQRKTANYELNRECSTIPCAYLGTKKEMGSLARECSTIPCAYLGQK